MHNPYLELYNQYGFELSQGVTSELAQLVASQAALMHNALGYAIRDLVRVVSYKYVEDQNGRSSPAIFEAMVSRRIAEDNGRLSNHLNEVIDSEEKSLSDVREYEATEVVVDNGREKLVMERNSATTYHPNPHTKRNIVNLEDDDPPENVGIDFMEYACRNKKTGQQQPYKQGAQLRDKMKCCRCRCICDPIQHGPNLYCSKCLPNNSNGPVF